MVFKSCFQKLFFKAIFKNSYQTDLFSFKKIYNIYSNYMVSVNPIHIKKHASLLEYENILIFISFKILLFKY